MRSSSRSWLAGWFTLVLTAGAPRVEAERRYPPVVTVLGDPQATPYRAHVARMGAARVLISGDDAEDGGHQLDLQGELPVAGEADGKVRLVSEYDHARVLVWVDADDLSWALTTPVRLRGKGDAGAWLSTGAPVTVRGRGPRRTVTYVDDDVRFEGQAPARALDRVFATTVAVDAVDAGDLATAHDLQVAPGGASLYRGSLAVVELGRRDGWVEVEHTSRYVRLRGWVRARDLVDDGLRSFSTGGLSTFSISDVPRVDVPAGACLYDRRGGAPAGVQLAPSRRYVAGGDDEWLELYVGSAWGTVRVWAHATGSGAATQWDRCATVRSLDDAPAE